MTKKVLHLITGLGKGGAETMLYQVIKYQRNAELCHQVVSLGAAHYYEIPLRERNIKVTVLDIKHHLISSLLRLRNLMNGADTVCCWMYHANLVGYLASRRAGVKRIVWCIRHSDLNPRHNSTQTLLINRICARWSKNVSVILYNGNRARKVHEEVAGYCRDKGFVVDNGCDCEEYAPNSCAAENLRKELGIADDKRIILSVTKATPIKDIPTFIKALSELHGHGESQVAVLCGQGVEAGNKEIAASCREFGLEIGKDIFFLGMRHDVPMLLASCDLYVLHSAGEAFPNVLIQAMSCGCICVVTDTGDARRILNRDDCVVPPGEAKKLAEKMEAMLSLRDEAAASMRRENRERVQKMFNIREIVQVYEKYM